MRVYNYEIEAEDAEKLLHEIDAKCDHGESLSRYEDGIKDAVGWLLGYYDRPEID